MGDIRNPQIIGNHDTARTPSKVSGGFEACLLLKEQVNYTESLLEEAQTLMDEGASDEVIALKLEEYESSNYKASQIRATYDCIRYYQKNHLKDVELKQQVKLYEAQAMARDARIAELEAQVNSLKQRPQILGIVRNKLMGK